MINARAELGKSDILFITLDTLRFDVADRALRNGRTPQLAKYLPNGAWERRHSPGSFTYAAHHAFFAGFLPTPATPGTPFHPRLFASQFVGSLTATDQTLVFDTPDIVSGFAQHGYHTVCIGGVGFFNKLNPLGRVLPSLFRESHWSPELGVACDKSTENQVNLAIDILGSRPANTRTFLFLNVSALHEPNRIFSTGASADSPQTQADALSYADGHLGRLLSFMASRHRTLCIICSDHGTAYGEDGYSGHRLAHPVVWDVPYAEFILESIP